MKFLLSIIICSQVAGTCLDPYPWPTTFDSQYNCLMEGYEQSILKMKEIAMQYIGEELFGMFQQGMLEQMVEPDGSFTYVVTDKFKGSLEKAITRFHDSADDGPF